MAPPRKKQKLRGSNGKFIKADIQPSPSGQQAEAEPVLPAYEPPSEPAIQRLLDTVEIVELILLYLPIRDLLLATRVIKTWHDIIYRSISLRRALFFEPVGCGSVSYLDWRYDDKSMYPESLELGEHIRGPKRNRRPVIYPRRWGKARSDAGQYRVFVDPLLVDTFPFLKPDGCYFKKTVQDLPEAARYGFASWRRMYFTQPPVDTLVLEWDSGSDPALPEEDEDKGEGEDAGAEDDDDMAGTIMTIPMPAIPGTNPPATTPTVPVPVTPGMGGANGAAAGNTGAGNAGAGNAAGNSRGYDADWTVSCMEDLLYRLEIIGCPAWIDGRDLWESYEGVEDLGRVVVRGK